MEVLTEGLTPPAEVAEFLGGPWSSVVSGGLAFLSFALFSKLRRDRRSGRLAGATDG